MATAMTLDEITGGVVDAAYRLHKGLGPGLLESVYERVLARDLQQWCANGETGITVRC
jgi:iron complex transport system substrate-binding protein